MHIGWVGISEEEGKTAAPQIGLQGDNLPFVKARPKQIQVFLLSATSLPRVSLLNTSISGNISLLNDLVFAIVSLRQSSIELG